MPPPNAERVPFYFLLSIELFTLAWLSAGQQLMGDFYEPSPGVALLLAFMVAVLTALTWRWTVRLSRRGCVSRPGVPIRIPRMLVWVVFAANVAATILFDYGRVGYAGVPLGFLITILPLDALILAAICARGRIDWVMLAAYAALGLLRGWTSHLFLMFLLILLMSPRRRQIGIIVMTLLLITILFEPLMAIRAAVRGFNDAEGGILYRLGSRLAMTPIIDYLFNHLPAILICQGEPLMPGWRELLAAVIPKGLLGDGGTKVIHYCVAAAAAGDPNVEITFSTTLFPKLISFALEGGTNAAITTAAVLGLLIIQLRLARQLLGRFGYVYVGAFLHVFIVSGVLRDVVIPTYFLLLLSVARQASTLPGRIVGSNPQHNSRSGAQPKGT